VLLGLKPGSTAMALPTVTLARRERDALTVGMAQILGAMSAEQPIPRPSHYLELERQFGLSAWVWICLARRYRDLTSAPMRFMLDTGDGSPEPLKPDHPLEKLLGKNGAPNPWMTPAQLLGMVDVYECLVGNAFWIKFRNRPGGEVLELWPVNPVSMQIWSHPDRYIGHYELWHYGRSWKFAPEDVIHFALPNPLSYMNQALPSPWGTGAIEAGYQLVATDNEAVRWNRSLMRNDGRPTGMLVSDLDISPEDSQRASDEYRRVFSGPDRAGRVLVTGKNLKYVRLADTPKELDYAKTMIRLREELLALLGLNSAVLGLAQGDIGRRREQMQSYWEDTIVSTSQAFLCPPITRGLAHAFDVRISAEQDFSDVRALQENEDERSKYVRSYWEMGVPFAALNDRYNLGFEPFEGWELSYVTAGAELATAKPTEPTSPILPNPADPTADPDDERTDPDPDDDDQDDDDDRDDDDGGAPVPVKV
jgi:phage portal protein BeeE